MKNSAYDIPEILEELRNGYRQSLEAPLPVTEDLIEVLCFQVGNLFLGCSSDQSAQVITPPRLVPIPRATGPVSSVFNHRGAILATLDLRPLFDIACEKPLTPSHVIMLKGADFQTGLLVEKLLGSETVPRSQIACQPDRAENYYRYCGEGEFQSRFGAIRLLDIAQILSLAHIIIDN